MSSWFVLSSLGLYPVNPVSGEYALTPSLFSKVLIDLPSGHKLEIRNDLASGMGGNNKVSVDFDKCSFYFNGKKLSGYFISHELLSGGGTLVFRCD
jgi:putative alpha-1,2-mannosidase